MSAYEQGYLIGWLIGGIAFIYLMTRLVLLAFRDKKYDTRSIVIAACIVLFIATILGGYSFAEGGPPNFLNAFLYYVLQTLIVIGIEIARVKVKKAKSGI